MMLPLWYTVKGGSQSRHHHDHILEHCSYLAFIAQDNIGVPLLHAALSAGNAKDSVSFLDDRCTHSNMPCLAHLLLQQPEIALNCTQYCTSIPNAHSTFLNSIMVHARSCSFQRTIKGQLQRSLRWWLPHHCSVPPLPPATLVRLISELCQNTSSTPIPPTKPAFLSLSLTTSTMCYLPQHNQSPTMLRTCSMFQANHITHAPVLEVMSRGHHKDLWRYTSASFSTLQNTSLLIICSFYYHMLFKLTPYMFMFCHCIILQFVVCILLVWIST